MAPAARVIEAAAPASTQRYAACGLTIAADAPIAGLVPAGEAPADVAMALHAGTPIPPVDSAETVWHSSPYLDASGAPLIVAARHAREGHYWLRYSEGAAFRVDQTGSRVDAWWAEPLTEVDVATYLLGPVLAFVLRLRGRVPLHASGVAVDGCAVLFAGAAGAGKSTTAAALAKRGHPLLSDDVVPVTADRGGRPLAWPGYPRLSLCADAADALFADGPEMPAFSVTYRKRYLDLDAAGLTFAASPLPVGLVVVLTWQEGPGALGVRPLGPREGLMALLPHTYGSYLIDGHMRAREFDLLGLMAASVPVWEVRFGGRLENIAAECAALVERMRERSYGSHT
jgi:hypothetical protein